MDYMENTAMKNSILLPQGFAYLADIDPSIIQDVRYATSNNFIGRPIAGYEREVIIITEVAGKLLKDMQQFLQPKGIGLKVFDAYRPQMACDNFWHWGQDPTDLDKMEEYYPDYSDKTVLFENFIARYSAHSRGSTVDLTLVNLKTKEELDMGSPFDFFGDVSYALCQDISDTAKSNRKLLRETMEKFGFAGIKSEWWHFVLTNEPFTRNPEDHFNFLVA
jgi:D-alanyl-D-alanine dipeptidase